MLTDDLNNIVYVYSYLCSYIQDLEMQISEFIENLEEMFPSYCLHSGGT